VEWSQQDSSPCLHLERAITLVRESPTPSYEDDVSPRVDDGEALFEQTLAQGYEGVVAKRRSSIYRCGERNGSWIKAKHGARVNS
jgi:bifunctional non-homologous end joining protein LigD